MRRLGMCELGVIEEPEKIARSRMSGLESLMLFTELRLDHARV